MNLTKMVCEVCNHVVEADYNSIGLECPNCGDYEVNPVDKVVEVLTEYESIVNK